MSRRTRTLLLTAINLLYPKVPESVTEMLKLKRQKAKWYDDRSSRSLPEIEIGQDIRVAPLQKNQTWKTGTCIEKLSDRSYVVKTNLDNQVLRRNREFLKPTEQPATQTQPIVVTESQPAKHDVQTPVPEQKSTPSRLPAVKKTRTRAVKALHSLLLLFCYFYKSVHFKGREMLRYCIILVDHVMCSCCIMCSLYGH